MRLIDTHCHLAHGRLSNQLPAVLDRARQAGLIGLICAAGNLRESIAAQKIAAAHDDVYFLAGQHPHDAKDSPEDYLTRIEELSRHPKNVAIGEIGLDYHYDYSPRPVQRRVFAEQLDLATRLGKPVVIHTREAFDETLSILTQSGLDGEKVVFHSFTEPLENLRRALDTAATISFSGIVTFKNAEHLRHAARFVPDDRLLIETDAPFLSPEPLRRIKTNEPAHVAHVAACLAEVRNTTPQELAELTTLNAIRILGLEL